MGGIVRQVFVSGDMSLGGKTEVFSRREADVGEGAEQDEGYHNAADGNPPTRRLDGQEPIEQKHRRQQQRHVHRQQVAAVDTLTNRQGHDRDHEYEVGYGEHPKK